MVSESQRLERLQKLSSILLEMKHCSNISEISEKTKIPPSTIQRYLNRPDYFMELSEAGLLSRENVTKAFEFTKDWLATAKKEGLRNGGKTSQERHGFSKGSHGHFSGSCR